MASLTLQDRLKYLILISTSLSGITAITGLVGLHGTAWLLATLGPNFVPIAPTAAYSFVLLALAVIVYTLFPNRFARGCTLLVTTFVLVVDAILLFQYLFGFDLHFENLFIPVKQQIRNVDFRMSPISAFLFTLTEISILMLVIRRESQLVRNIAASLTAVTATVASVVIIGYGYGTPLFYGENSLLPVALLAAIAFLLLNIGVLTIASPDNWVVQQFAGNSVRAILLRTFLPLTLAILIAHGWLGFYFVSHYRTNPALATAVFAIITLFLVGTIIAFVASGIGGQIDQVEQEKKAFYRETILNATEGKLRISDEDDVMPYVDNAQVSTELNSAPEVGNVREKVKQFLEEHGLVGERLNDLMIAVSEAMANVVKHAGHGRIYVGVDDLSAWVVICDNGPGMESLTLPKAVLLKGFSTKNSLGLGYSIMLQMADRIILKTDKNGTEVVLVKDIAQEAVITLDNIPDTWGGIG